MIHVAAGWQAPDGALFSLRIGPAAPRSATDAFVLALARARARSILTTGRILRDEPELLVVDPSPEGALLASWRRERLGEDGPPRLGVLTRGRELDFDHPVFAGTNALVVTGRAAAGSLSERASARGVEVIGRETPGLLDAIALLHARGLAPVLVEAGPSTASVLYEAAGRVDELLLSICHAPSLPARAQGARLPDADARARAGLCEVSRVERDEPSGRWTFTRHRRA